MRRGVHNTTRGVREAFGRCLSLLHGPMSTPMGTPSVCPRRSEGAAMRVLSATDLAGVPLLFAGGRAFRG